MGCNMLEQDRGVVAHQLSDEWICAAIDGSWGNDDEVCDDDDLHDVFTFGA